MAVEYRPPATAAEILQKNQIYDRAANSVWRLAVYNPVHDGWEFTNMGGHHVLDFIGQHAALDSSKAVVEFCSGLGDTCLYLAAKFGCHLTGIDMNVHQVEHARAKVASVAQAIAARLCYVHSDLLSWQPGNLFDVVYALDSFMLIADIPSILKKARSSLKRRGMLVLAEMISGPGITSELRKFAWEVDGIISLPTAAEYEEMIKEAGFGEVEFQDITVLAANCFDKIHAATRQHKQEIVSEEGDAVYQSWLQLSDLYRRCFQERRFLYMQINALRDDR